MAQIYCPQGPITYVYLKILTPSWQNTKFWLSSQVARIVTTELCVFILACNWQAMRMSATDVPVERCQPMWIPAPSGTTWLRRAACLCKHNLTNFLPVLADSSRPPGSSFFVTDRCCDVPVGASHLQRRGGCFNPSKPEINRHYNTCALKGIRNEKYKLVSSYISWR